MAPKATADDVLEERVLQKRAQLKGRVRAAGRLLHVLSCDETNKLVFFSF